MKQNTSCGNLEKIPKPLSLELIVAKRECINFCLSERILINLQSATIFTTNKPPLSQFSLCALYA